MKSLKMKSLILAGMCVLTASGIVVANMNSDRIESTAKKSYVFKTYLKDDNIKIKAMDDSVVILTGEVSQMSHSSLAEETVAGLPGVKRVDNKLDVKGDQPEKNSDGWIAMKVKTLLMFHRNVSVMETDVKVKDGIVTLNGHANNAAQIELTTEYIKDVEGVKSVRNEMSVKKTDKTLKEKVGDNVDDASITAQVKITLLFHASTSAVNIKVVTKDGIVTVSGVAKNGAEKDLVGKLVKDINGVLGLVNQITIG